MNKFLDRLLSVASPDPDVRRRARFLNVCLLAVILATVALALVNLPAGLDPNRTVERTLAIAEVVALVGGIVSYLLNRYRWHILAGYLFLFLLIGIITASTRPVIYIFEGSTILAYVLPIIMASVILQPWSAFVITTIISVMLVVVARAAGIADDPSAETLATLYMLALVAFLSASSLNSALREAHERAEELRVVNLELDQRVADRTTDLSQANRDLTRALQREHAEANKNQAILSSIADGVIVLNESRQAIVANPAIGGMLALPTQAILGRRLGELINSDGSSQVSDAIARAFSGGASSAVRFNFEQGKQIIATSLSSVDLPGEQGAGVVAVFHDVTREVEANRAKSEFVSTVSHELRTPLTSIKGYIDLLSMEAAGLVNERQRSFLATIKTNADRLTDLLNDLLEISRVETGRIKLELTDVDLVEVIRDVVMSLKPQLDKKSLDLTVEVAPDLSRVRGDRSRLTQVMTNLLSNAQRYTPAGGSIIVRAHRVGTEVRVDVQDSGIGISPQDQARLFQRFFRASDPRVSEIPGTGLGLAISRMFVELHGGRIWVDSRINEGSTFTFALPALELAPSAQQAAAEPPAPVKTGQKVLIVDDEQNIAELIRYYLTGAGYQASVLHRGREVLARAAADLPDLIILDILLPDVNGFDVLRELKGQPSTAHIPVVILSVIHDRETGFQLGAADYLTKPLQGQVLLQSVQRVLKAVDAEAGRNILVVDDEQDVRNWLKESLGVAGFSVQAAENGLQALESVSRARPDLMLLDLNMPGLDGRTVIRNLKADPATCSIPIIVLTGSPPSSEDETLALLGTDERFLTKPISAEALIEEIQRSLPA